MKKLISIFCTLVVFTANIQAVTTNAVTDTKVNRNPYLITDNVFTKTVKASENPDLKALADSLGAGTDCLNIKNYITGDTDERPVSKDSLKDFLNNCSNITFSFDPESNFYASLKGGSCLGISLLEILAHNGLISPSDIKSVAKYLKDISYTEDVGKYITDYQVLQCQQEFELYNHWFRCRKSNEEKVTRLLEDAETATKNGKYFLINFFTPTFGHAVTGIGITDGLWTYNDINYDKCILTLDSNVVNQLTGEKGFSEKTCIYVNSETKQFYIPAYDCNSENNDSEIFSMADDKLFNYRGTIKPTDSTDTDISLINKFIVYNSSKSDFSITVTNPDGTTYDGINDSYKHFSASETNHYYFLDGSSFHIESKNPNEDSIFLTHIINERRHIIPSASGGDASFDIDDNKVKISSLNNEEIEYDLDIRFNEDEYNFSPHNTFWFNGPTDNEVWFEQADEGIIIGGDKGIKCSVYSFDMLFNGKGKPVSSMQNQKSVNVTAYKSLLVTFDDYNNLMFKIDADDDGVYESVQQQGDANADGVIDASDASTILAGYANASSGKQDYLNERICDYNLDGKVDASDASAVLAYYADISSGKTE